MPTPSLCFHLLACQFLPVALQNLMYQQDGIERTQARLTVERVRLSAWRDKVASLETALEDLAGHFGKNAALQPPGLGTPPALKLKSLSHLFHKVCTRRLICTVLSGSVLQLAMPLNQMWLSICFKLGHRASPCFGQFLF